MPFFVAAVAIRVTPQIQVSLLAACTAHCSLNPPRKTAGGFDVVRYRRVRGASWLCSVFAATRAPAPLGFGSLFRGSWLLAHLPPGSLFRGSCRRSRLRVPPADPSRWVSFHQAAHSFFLAVPLRGTGWGSAPHTRGSSFDAKEEPENSDTLSLVKSPIIAVFRGGGRNQGHSAATGQPTRYSGSVLLPSPAPKNGRGI